MLDFKTCPLGLIADYIEEHHSSLLERDSYHALCEFDPPPWMSGEDYEIDLGTRIHEEGEAGWYTLTRQVGRYFEQYTFGFFYT